MWVGKRGRDVSWVEFGLVVRLSLSSVSTRLARRSYDEARVLCTQSSQDCPSFTRLDASFMDHLPRCRWMEKAQLAIKVHDNSGTCRYSFGPTSAAETSLLTCHDIDPSNSERRVNSSRNGRQRETSPISTRDRGLTRDSQVSEIDGFVDPAPTVCARGSRNRARILSAV